MNNFLRWFPLTESLSDSVRYRPNSNPFGGFQNLKVVAHLRRGDISAKLLMPQQGKFAGWLGKRESQRAKGLREKPLLELRDVVEDLEERLEVGSKCSLIVVSDGFSRQLTMYKNRPNIVKKIKKANQNLLEVPKSRKLHINFLEALIGSSEEITVRTLDAFHHADLIYTTSSAFPSLITSSLHWNGRVVRMKKESASQSH